MKTDGVKAIVTMSSSVAQMGRVSESARALDTPLAPFDKFQFAYKVSKSALNQGACCVGCEIREIPRLPGVTSPAELRSGAGRRRLALRRGGGREAEVVSECLTPIFYQH